MNKLITSVLLFALLQVALSQTEPEAAETIKDVIDEYKPLINERQRRIGMSIGLNSKLMGQTYGVLQDGINENIANLTDRIGQLDDVLKASIAQAQEQGKNVDECVAAENARIQPLNVNEIRDCLDVQQLMTTRQKMMELTLLQREIGLLVSRCVVLNQVDTSNARACLDNGLQNIDNTIENLNKDVESLLGNAATVVNECVVLNRSRVESLLNEIQAELQSCVDAQLNA